MPSSCGEKSLNTVCCDDNTFFFISSRKRHNQYHLRRLSNPVSAHYCKFDHYVYEEKSVYQVIWEFSLFSRSLLFPDWTHQSLDDLEQLQKDLMHAHNGIFIEVHDVLFTVGEKTLFFSVSIHHFDQPRIGGIGSSSWV